MNHNPHNLEVLEVVILDKDFANSSKVRIMGFSKNQLFTFVNGDIEHDKIGDMKTETWQVMTNRLTPIDEKV